MSACSCSQIWTVGGYTIHMCNRTEFPLPSSSHFENKTNASNVSESVSSPSTLSSPSPYLQAVVPSPAAAVAASPSSSGHVVRAPSPPVVVASPSSIVAYTSPSSSPVSSSPSSARLYYYTPSPIFASPSPTLHHTPSRTPAANTNTPSTWIDANINEEGGVILEPSSSGFLLNHQPPVLVEESFNPLYLLLLTPFFCLIVLFSWRYKRSKKSRIVSPRDVKLKDKAPVAKPVPKTVKMENPVIEALKLQDEVNKAFD